jgi:hypothetical protein
MRTERLRVGVALATLLCPLLAVSGAGAQESPSSVAPAPTPAAATAQAAETPRSGRVVTGDFTVAAGESVDGLVVVGGDLRVQGEITGDAVVVGGDLILEASGLVLGDAVVTGGEILQQGGRVRGELRMMGADEDDIAESIEEVIVAPAAPEAPAAVRGPEPMRFEHHGRSWFHPIQRGFAGILSTLALGLVLAGAGALLIFYGQRYLDTASDTIRSSTLRSGGVGMAAFFLVVPAFVVLVVALAVSILGIPLLLVAVPLYPLAVAAAVAFGLLASAHALGERTAEQRREAYDMRYRNSYAYLFTGLGMLLTPLLAADLISMTGFLGFLGILLKVVTWVVIWAAATIGFGAVILSRFGTQRSFIPTPAGEPTIEPDPLFDEPSPRGTDV